MVGREFTLKYEFNDVGKLTDMRFYCSPVEEHFGVRWQIKIQRRDQHLGMYTYADVHQNQEIHLDRIQKMISKNKETICSKSSSRVFNTSADWGWHKFIEWQTLENQYLNDGKLEVEIDVKIIKMTGFRPEKLRSFGEDVKQFSDVILKVKDTKFYVSKLFLSSQSPYFAALFLGQFEESGKTEIELKDLNPQYLQYYLEVLYGEPGIDEETVEGILTIADMYDTPVVDKKCKKFLMKHEDLKLKLKMAGKFRLEELKKSCMDQLKSKEDIRSVIPENSDEMDYEILVELLKKSLDLKK